MDGWMVDAWMHMDGWMDGWMVDVYLSSSSFHPIWYGLLVTHTHLPCMTSAHIHMATGRASLIVAGTLNIDLGIGQAMF